MLFFLKYISQTQEISFERLEKMLKKGFDIDTIVELTGLKKEEIEKLSDIS